MLSVWATVLDELLLRISEWLHIHITHMYTHIKLGANKPSLLGFWCHFSVSKEVQS